MLKLLWTLRDNISMKLSLAGLRSSLEPISDMLSEQYSDRLYSASPLAQQSVEVVQVEQWVEVASNSAGSGFGGSRRLHSSSNQSTAALYILSKDARSVPANVWTLCPTSADSGNRR